MAPVVYATLTKGQILQLAKDKDVSRIFLHETEGIDDLQDSINIADTNFAHFRVTGQNVRVAVWEWGPDNLNELVIIRIAMNIRRIHRTMLR